MSSQKAVNLSAIILSVVVVCHGGMWYFTSQTKCKTVWPRKPLSFSPGTLQYVLLYTVPPAVAQAQKSKLWRRICVNQELSMGQFTLLLRLAPPFTLSPAVPGQVAVSIQAHSSQCHVGMPVLFCALGCDGAEMETNTEVWVPHTDWRRRACPQFCFTLLLASSGDTVPFPWHCSAEQGSCSVIPVRWHDSIMVWGTISWACFGPPGELMLTMPLVDARLGLMTWMRQHWEEEWAETSSSSFSAVPSADQTPSLQQKSWLELKQPAWGKVHGVPWTQTGNEWEENNWRTFYVLNWHFSVSCEVSRDEGHPTGQFYL